MEEKQCKELLLHIGANHHINTRILQAAYDFFCRHYFRLGLLYSRKWRALAAFALYQELREQKNPKTLKEMTAMFEGVKTRDIHRMEQHISPDLCHSSTPSQYLHEASYFLDLSWGEKVAVETIADQKFKEICLRRQLHPKSILGVCLYEFLKNKKKCPNISLKRIARLLNVSASCLKRNKSMVLKTPPFSFNESAKGRTRKKM